MGVAGSMNSHASMQSQSGGSRMTLLFSGISEVVCNIEAEKRAAKKSIEAFVMGILKDARVQPDLYSVSASFATPRKAPPGGCWVNFTYTVENCRVNRADGKILTFDTFKKLHKGDDKSVALQWMKCKDPIQQLETELGGDGTGGPGARKHVAQWFMNKVNGQYLEGTKIMVPVHGLKGTNFGDKLSVQWMRA